MAEQRVDWREAQDADFTTGPDYQDLTDAEKAMIERINDELGWEKFRLVDLEEKEGE